MHGRTATVRPASIHTGDAGASELRRRVAAAVARRFGGPVRPVAHSSTASVAASMAGFVEMPVSRLESEAETETETAALDARVRQTGEW